MISVNFEFDDFIRSLGQLGRDLDAGCYRTWEDQGKLAARSMQQSGFKNQTGALSQSMMSSPAYKASFSYGLDLTANTYYALWVDEGTAPHAIVAQNGHPLHFYWPKVGRWVSFWSVFHPGSKPAGFSTMVASVYGEIIPDRLQHTVDSIIQSSG
jgi:hypothetical protein